MSHSNTSPNNTRDRSSLQHQHSHPSFTSQQPHSQSHPQSHSQHSNSSMSQQPARQHAHSLSSRKPSLLRNHSGYQSQTLSKRSSGSTGSGNNSGENSLVNSPSVLTSTNMANSKSSSNRSQTKSLGSMLANNLQHQNSLFVNQERAYIRRIRNQIVDDYYTKGITGADESKDNDTESNINDEDEDDIDEETEANTSLLVDMDDDNYQLDMVSASNLLANNMNDLKINPNKNITQLQKDGADDPAVLERLEWQAMLTSVLTGDVVKSEKTKINNNNLDEQESYLHATYKESLWFGIKAKLVGRTEDDQRKIISYRRTLVDNLIDEVMKFEIAYDDPLNNPPKSQVTDILERYDKCCELWRTLEEMKNEKPQCKTDEFQNRIDSLTAWLSITTAIERETKSLQIWIGNDELDISKSPLEKVTPASTPASESPGTENPPKKIFEEDNKSLAEKLMKEKDVHSIFTKRIFAPLAPWMMKSKDTYIRLGYMFETLKLPDYIHDLIQLCIVPMKLIREIINVRLRYAIKLQNPTLMMIDQMIEDFRTYITIALEVRLGVQEYCKSDIGKIWVIEDFFVSVNSTFDETVLECLRYKMVLLNRKLLDSARSPTNFRTFKEPEELEESYNYVKLLGNFIDGGGTVVAEQITLLTSRLIQRLLAYYNHQVRSLPSSNPSVSELVRWYSSTTENFGQLRRKLARFTGEISRDFTNSLVFDISYTPNYRTKNLLDVLKATDHFLVYTGTVETQGTYFFASSELFGNEQDILKIINGSYIGIESQLESSGFSELLNILKTHEESEEFSQSKIQQALPSHSKDFAYVLAFCPPKPIVWEGEVINVNIENVPITDVKTGQMLLISKLPSYSLHIVREKFLDIVGEVLYSGNGVIKPIEQRCSLARVHHELTRVNKNFFKMSLSVLDSVKIVREQCNKVAPEGGCQEIINNYFVYARDHGKNSVKNLDSSRKSTVIVKLIQLCTEWVSFICDDCVPTDRKTFRWCVSALEFAMYMTRGFNVLVLKDEQFHKLKLKVARCMSLLISHFDITGVRMSEAEQRKLARWTSQRTRIENSADDEYIINAHKEDMMEQIDEIEKYRSELQGELNSVGRVLDITDLEYQFVTLLASSFSSVSIRWQKGKFIGSGSFGNVFGAVNLDTGGVMAVKEIRFNDSQLVKNLVPSIRDEMTVLEMLNHPNVVQYFGVEVHRDKVYIFMEFCEGGSLAGLLIHGRIEDEMVIQVYTLQMLEGLAYLHQSGVVHRDIKPENVLLDHNGVIKFVDFGAAKVIATSGRTQAPTNSNKPKVGGDHNNLNSMTGTPMYMSPEVITGSSSDKNGVVDIWSLGCCVLEMATGRRPWANLDNEWAIMYHIAAGHKPQLPSADQLSEAGIKFIARCLEHDPKKRPSAVELLNDPWIIQIKQAAFGGSDAGLSTPSSEGGVDM